MPRSASNWTTSRASSRTCRSQPHPAHPAERPPDQPCAAKRCGHTGSARRRLYNNALRDYNAARYDLALSQFQDYLKYYPNTDLAGNAQFYIADMEYRSGNFEAALCAGGVTINLPFTPNREENHFLALRG